MTEADYQAFLLRSEAESELADKLYVEKLKRLNERKKANSKKLREMGIKPYAGQKKKASPQTICPNCKHCCPNPIKGIGCEWSVNFQPVPGWNAIRKDIAPNHVGGRYISSYIVVSCPKFIEG